MSDTVDIKTLEQLADRLKRDATVVRSLTAGAMLSIADLIERAIGAPASWPSRRAGALASEEYFPGSPTARHAFNAGVKWAVENYVPTVEGRAA